MTCEKTVLSFLKIIAGCKGPKMVACRGNYHTLSPYQLKVKKEFAIISSEIRTKAQIHCKIKFIFALTHLTISKFPPLILWPEIKCSDCVAGSYNSPFSTKFSLAIHWGIHIQDRYISQTKSSERR